MQNMIAAKTNIPVYIVNFAATYNCGAYGAGQFDTSGQCATTTTTTTSGGTSGQSGGGNSVVSSLTDTGINIILPIVGGLLLIALAITILRKKPKNR